jgi:hypothetical protein
MICKDWKKAGLFRSVEKTFQVEAMKDNITTPLFSTMQDPNATNTMEYEFTSEGYAYDPNDSMEEAMVQSLNKVTILCSCPTKSTASIANL